MPLVVPGLQSSSNSKLQDWENKLMGKTIGDVSNETTFAKKDLPSETRVHEEGAMLSRDHKPERLNVQHGSDGTVNKVWHG